MGICGEHGATPSPSLRTPTPYGCGVDYVSCSSYRIPVARLAGAQAVFADILRVSDEPSTSAIPNSSSNHAVATRAGQ